MRLDSFFSGALCVLSGGRLPEALFMVFYWIPKVQKRVNLVDLVKSFQTSIYYLLVVFSTLSRLAARRSDTTRPPDEAAG